MLTGGQTYFDRNYADDPAASFYRFGGLDNAYLCGSGTYPCGSVAGTPRFHVQPTAAARCRGFVGKILERCC